MTTKVFGAQWQNTPSELKTTVKKEGVDIPSMESWLEEHNMGVVQSLKKEIIAASCLVENPETLLLIHVGLTANTVTFKIRSVSSVHAQSLLRYIDAAF